MKSIRLDETRDRVRRLVQEANFILPEDVAARLEAMAATEAPGLCQDTSGEAPTGSSSIPGS